ncbi:MAG: hypothetical protein OXP10_07625 [Chloroflexota bacterium]|nr:hypothetical protein [Chloroflexota bacterium]
MSIYTRLVRPLLFRLPPERAQRLAETFLVAGPVWRAVSALDDPRLHAEVAGIRLPNPIGLAAGYDKDCAMLGRRASRGLGYMVGGTVTAQPRPGNPRPRIVRNPGGGSLVNSLGFPSRGVEEAARRLSRRAPNVPLLLSISGLTLGEFSLCYRKLSPLCGGVELNVSSPNTEGIRVFQEPGRLGELLSALSAEKTGPLFLKLPPYFDDDQRDGVMRLVDVCLDGGVEGVTVSNTHPVPDERLAVGRGGMSGRPLLPHTLRMVSEVRRQAGDGLAINGCGGISSGEDALSVLRAGADTLQLFTGFVYEGPGLMKRIKRYLLDRMEEEGASSLAELTRAAGASPPHHAGA